MKQVNIPAFAVEHRFLHQKKNMIQVVVGPHFSQLQIRN